MHILFYFKSIAVLGKRFNNSCIVTLLQQLKCTASLNFKKFVSKTTALLL